MIDTILYIRVSSEEQNTARQEKDLKDWATKTGSTNTKTIIEKISGSVAAKDRRLNEVFLMQGIKRVVVQDIDRLGRDTIDILQTIKSFTSSNINLTVTALGMDTLLPNGKENQSFKIVLSVMATLSELERMKIKERQMQGIAIAKAEGKYKGRQKGTVKTPIQILAKHKNVVRQLRANQSIRNIAKICKVSPTTVQTVKKAMVLHR
jgi:DNA invertase Pin-like site-specific DNA recombinase